MKRLLLVLGLGFAWNCPGVEAAPASSTGANAQAAPRNAGLAKIYRKAVEAYEQKRYDEAADGFRQVLERFDHTPSKIYLARSLYQQKNLVEALKVFHDIDVKALEPDAAYDYGQTAFRSGEYDNAIKAFAIVPNGHPLYDLAGYYGGISAYKTGDFQHAIDLFDQAVVLPSKLVRSQKLYRQEAEKKLFQRQKAEVQATGIPIMKGSKKDNQAGTNFVYDLQKGVSLTHSYKNQTTDVKKGPSEDFDMQRTTLGLYWGSDKPAPSAKTQWIYLADLRLSSTKDNDKEIPLLANPSDVLENATLDRFTPDSLVRTELAGGYEMGVGNTSALGFIGGAYAYAGDGDFSEKLLYSPYVSVFLSQKGDLLETRVSLGTYPQFDSKQLSITQTVQDGLLQFNLSKTLYFALKGQLNEYSYNVERLNGADWNGRGQLELGYRKGKGLSLALGTFYEVAQGWRLYDVAQELPLVKFNLNQVGGYASANLNLTSWWIFGFDGKFAKNSFANVLPAEGEQFPVGGRAYLDENYGTTISQFTVYTSFYKNF